MASPGGSPPSIYNSSGWSGICLSKAGKSFASKFYAFVYFSIFGKITYVDIVYKRKCGVGQRGGAQEVYKFFDVSKLLEADDLRLKILKEVGRDEEPDRMRPATISPRFKNAEERQKVIAEMKDSERENLGQSGRIEKATGVWAELMFLVPNIPDVGARRRERRAKCGHKNGRNSDFKAKGFEPKCHKLELMQNLDMADFERGAKVSGFRGYFLKTTGALLLFRHMAASVWSL